MCVGSLWQKGYPIQKETKGTTGGLGMSGVSKLYSNPIARTKGSPSRTFTIIRASSRAFCKPGAVPRKPGTSKTPTKEPKTWSAKTNAILLKPWVVQQLTALRKVKGPICLLIEPGVQIPKPPVQTTNKGGFLILAYRSKKQLGIRTSRAPPSKRRTKPWRFCQGLQDLGELLLPAEKGWLGAWVWTGSIFVRQVVLAASRGRFENADCIRLLISG